MFDERNKEYLDLIVKTLVDAKLDLEYGTDVKKLSAKIREAYSLCQLIKDRMAEEERIRDEWLDKDAEFRRLQESAK